MGEKVTEKEKTPLLGTLLPSSKAWHVQETTAGLQSVHCSPQILPLDQYGLFSLN